KVEEELDELKHEVSTNASVDRIEDEFGDLLFALVNYARYIGVNPEDALERTNRKFRSRFQYIEKIALSHNKQLHEMSLEEMDELWNEAKKSE
ncbi:MAG TPA: MazG nucleotide pyrophosphohydrolase domain-containing protein, partial [Bacteroidales bacterium]|nr:MazG nucleotide pyrophosphohydrolase domain-containing protein [Bacteroidales bacterium]